MGSDKPLFELKESRAKSPALRPDRVLVYPDRIEEVKPNLVRKRQHAIPIRQIAQVYVKNGPVWATVVIESTGGHLIEVAGLSKGEAEDARRQIFDLVSGASAPILQQAPSAPLPPPIAAAGGVADELKKLAELREAGVLSAKEFEKQKSKLLRR